MFDLLSHLNAGQCDFSGLSSSRFFSGSIKFIRMRNSAGELPHRQRSLSHCNNDSLGGSKRGSFYGKSTCYVIR